MPTLFFGGGGGGLFLLLLSFFLSSSTSSSFLFVYLFVCSLVGLLVYFLFKKICGLFLFLENL
jgi:hypothetical protein